MSIQQTIKKVNILTNELNIQVLRLRAIESALESGSDKYEVADLHHSQNFIDHHTAEINVLMEKLSNTCFQVNI